MLRFSKIINASLSISTTLISKILLTCLKVLVSGHLWKMQAVTKSAKSICNTFVMLDTVAHSTTCHLCFRRGYPIVCIYMLREDKKCLISNFYNLPRDVRTCSNLTHHEFYHKIRAHFANEAISTQL